MTTTFNDRERAFEAKFAADAEAEFKVAARAVKLVGAWAGALLGKTGPELDAYVAEVILADFEEAGVEDVLRKVCADLEGKADAETVRAKMGELTIEARAQLAQG